VSESKVRKIITTVRVVCVECNWSGTIKLAQFPRNTVARYCPRCEKQSVCMTGIIGISEVLA